MLQYHGGADCRQVATAARGHRHAVLHAPRTRARDQFIASIQEDDVLRLVSSYHNADPCNFFRTPNRGSYNICYFVQFLSQDGDTEKWAVRVPLEPCLAFGGQNKLESEIAAMQ